MNKMLLCIENAHALRPGLRIKGFKMFNQDSLLKSCFCNLNEKVVRSLEGDHDDMPPV